MERGICGMLVVMLLFACPVMKDASGDATEESDGFVQGKTIEDTSAPAKKSAGSISDPNRCRGLPPKEMADCLEEAMGG